MELSNLEEHRQEAQKAVDEGTHEPSAALPPDVEKERVESREAQVEQAAEEAQPKDPHARDAAATGEGGPGF